MIELGKIQTLEVVRIKDFGVYLGEGKNDETGVLLPARQVPDGTKEGDRLSVFIYKDSEDRLIATTKTPKLQVGEIGLLTVKEVGKIGAFLDLGLERDILLPFREQRGKVRPGQNCLVAVYVDKTSRLAATMRLYPYMRNDSPYGKDDQVSGTVYEINPELGAFVAVDDHYFGMIPIREFPDHIHEGDRVEARVVKVREDGKLDLNPRQKAYLQMEDDAEAVLSVIRDFDGVLPFTDKASPEKIQREFHLSKAAFKRAVGRLLKEGKIRITDETIELL